MTIFGYVLVPKEEYRDLTEAWHVRSRVYECHRWFSGWEDLDTIWGYLMGKTYAHVDAARTRYALDRKTDVYGKKIKRK